MKDSTKKSRSILEYALGLFTEVRAGEGMTALMFALNAFIVMFSYYILKVAREPLIIGDFGDAGPRMRSLAGGVQAVSLVFLLVLYNWLVSKLPTRQLIFVVVGFFLVCLEGFAFAETGGLPIGFTFFVWLGIFSNWSMGLFWSFANEAYDREAGERIFPLIGIGTSAGGIAGPLLPKLIFGEDVPTFLVLQMAAGLLAVHLAMYAAIMWRPDVTLASKAEPKKGAPKKGLRTALEGFSLVFSSRFVSYIALLILVLNLVNSTGEYVLSEYVVGSVKEQLSGAGDVADPKAWTNARIFAFYADFYFWVNVAGLVLQAFVASRLVKFLGIAGVLFALPLVSLSTYSLAALGVGFSLFRWGKAAENATDYSIMNTARAMLWLPTSREEKYKAKQTVDTLVVRIGDLSSTGLVFGGGALGLTTPAFAGVNVVLILAWLGLAWLVYRTYQRLSLEATTA